MRVRCWSDYLCPWCYVGIARDALFAEVGLEVEHLPYELHPEIGPEGRRVRPDGRLGPTFDRIEAECREVGLPFRRPTRMPNTRRALATSAWVLETSPEAHREVHAGLFAAHFADGEAIDDATVLDRIVTAAGIDPAPVRSAVEDGRADRLVTSSMDAARELGVASTPSWVVGDLVIPGALDPETMRRWVGRLAARHQPG